MPSLSRILRERLATRWGSNRGAGSQTEKNILAFIKKYGRVAPVEIRENF